MFVASFEKIDLGTTSEIVSFAKSSCGKFLCVVFRDCVQIRDLNSRRLGLLFELHQDEDYLKSNGFNHWIQWIGSSCVTVGTQAGHVLFLHLDTWGKIVETKSVSLGFIVTAHASAFRALIVATTGPSLCFVSPDGDVLSTLAFSCGSVPVLVRSIDVVEPFVGVTFSDGVCVKAVLTESDVIAGKALDMVPLDIKDVATLKISSNHKFVAGLCFTGYLVKLSFSGELLVINENASLFQLTRDGRYIISLEANGYLNVWSSQTMRNSRTKIDFPGLDAASNPNFITSELDLNGLCLFCGTSNEMFSIIFASGNSTIPSLIYHTPTCVVVPTTNTTIAAPQDMIANGYPVMSVTYCPSNKSTVLASRKCFAIHVGSQWHLVNDSNNLCRALWYQCGCFVTVVFDVMNSMYKLLLLRKEDLVVISEAQLHGFLCCDKFGNRIAIGASQSVTFFEIVDGHLRLVRRVNNLKPFDQVILVDGDDAYMILTHDNELVHMPDDHTLMESVSSVYYASSGLIFVVSHGQQFILFDDKVIRIGTPATHIEGLSMYIAPSEYTVGQFNWEVAEFLPVVLDHFLGEPDRMEHLVNSYLRTSGITLAVAHALERALDAEKFDLFNEFLNRTDGARDTYLIVSLFEVKKRYVPVVQHLLPPYDILITKFPQLRTQLQQIYGK